MGDLEAAGGKVRVLLPMGQLPARCKNGRDNTCAVQLPLALLLGRPQDLRKAVDVLSVHKQS